MVKRDLGPRQIRGAHRGHLPLDSLPLLQPAIIVSLPKDNRLLHRLASYGLLPGVEVVVERKVPAFIVTIGAIRIALDGQTARGIMVLTGGEQ